jgi:hypothetical protein
MDNEFAKSRNGKKFLESDLPQLVSVIGKLTEALLESNKIEEKRLLIEQKRFLNESREIRSATGDFRDNTEDFSSK